jgi:hypothetical protein
LQNFVLKSIYAKLSQIYLALTKRQEAEMMTNFYSWFLSGGFFTMLAISGAAAHHGWSWAEADQLELKGVIREVYIGPPHPTLDVDTASDGRWRIELGNPRQTERAGFIPGSAKIGDEIIALGNRSVDQGEKRMKAVRISVGGKTFDIYPDRIKTN